MSTFFLNSMKCVFLSLVALCAFSASVAIAQPTQVYSHGDPTDDEQQMLEMVNRARSNPAEEGVRLMDTDDAGVQFAYQFFSINKQATKQAFTTYPQRPPLAFHPSLITAARNHTADMAQNNFQGHVSSNGDQLNVRFQKAGYQPQGTFGENVAAYSNSVWHGHCGLNVDWGEQNQIELGHRENIMNFANYEYTEIGVGITKTNGGLQSGTVGPYVITQTFGIRNVRYITGVVYNDLNKNGFYDPGEGLAGVDVRPDRGTFYAVTSTSGGYAIPYTGNSSVLITASGGSLATPLVSTVQFSGTSIKVDFVPASSAPSVVTLLLPATNSTNVAFPVVFSWRPTAGATTYEFEASVTAQFSGAPLASYVGAETTTTVAALPCSTQVFWRVRAVNDQGPGEWSTPFSFTTHQILALIQTTTSPEGPVSLEHNNPQIQFVWQAPSNPALLYQLEVRHGGTVLYQDSTLTETSALVALPLEAGTYAWRVRAKNECGWHAFSRAKEFEVTVVSVHEGTAGAERFMISSPVTHQSLVNLPASEEPRRVSVVSLEGVVVADFDVEANVRTMPLSAMNSIASGVYIVVVRASALVYTATCIIAW